MIEHYVASFTCRLRTGITTTASGPITLRSPPLSPLLREVELLAEPKGGTPPSVISALAVRCHYEGQFELGHPAGGTIADGMSLATKARRFETINPAYDAAPVIAWFLYQVSGLTLQSHCHMSLDELASHVGDVTWLLPTGATVPGMPSRWPVHAVMGLRDTGERDANPDDFARLQAALITDQRCAPLWRLLLAEAHRERLMDWRNVVLRCATALDVALQPLVSAYSAGEKVDMRLFRGEHGRTPDLRLVDAPLFEQIKRLWYTRHGVVHAGVLMLYDENPMGGAPPLRRFAADDANGFLIAVPKAVSFVEANPP
jgi:hypothetical protein